MWAAWGREEGRGPVVKVMALQPEDLGFKPQHGLYSMCTKARCVSVLASVYPAVKI